FVVVAWNADHTHELVLFQCGFDALANDLDADMDDLRVPAVSVQRVPATWRLCHKAIAMQPIAKVDHSGRFRGGSAGHKFSHRATLDALGNLQVPIRAGFVKPTAHAYVCVTDRVQGH